MTEDATGVQNFLTDLEKKGYAASQALADGSKQWTYNIGDITDAAKDMGMSFDWFMDMFGRLEDYGAHNNFVGSVADGAERITDLSSKIAKAQAELAELQATGADNTAITQKKNEIAALQNDLAETRSATEQLAKHSADEYAEKIKQGKEQITTLLTERDRIKSTKAYGTDTDEVAKALETEIQKIANENGIELDANLNIVNAEEELDKISNKVIGIDVDLNNADELKEQAQKTIRTTQNLVNKYSMGYAKTHGINDATINFDSTNQQNLDDQIALVQKALLSNKKLNGKGKSFNDSSSQAMINSINALYAQNSLLPKVNIVELILQISRTILQIF